MPQLEIQPIGEADLPAVAEYVYRAVSRAPANSPELPISTGFGAKEFLELFRWRTADNPHRPAGMELGQLIRRDDGTIAGVHVVCPFRYRWHDRQLLGLCSNNYFADDDARIQAFFMFRRFLALPGADFYFANTCNRYSGQIWEKCGGRPAPDSDKQWLVPLRTGPLARELLVRRGWNRIAGVAQAAGGVADLFFGKPAAGELQIEPTNDLQFMAETVDRWRDPSQLVPERDVAYFHWTYDQAPPNARKRVFRFQDTSGQDGWFAIGTSRAGVDRNLELATILDWSVPRSPFDFASVVQAVVARFAGAADAVVFRPRIDMQIVSKVPRLRQRSYAAPQYYLIPSRRDEQVWEQFWITSQSDAV